MAGHEVRRQRGQITFVRIAVVKHSARTLERSYPAWTRTRNEGTKNPCVTITPPGSGWKYIRKCESIPLIGVSAELPIDVSYFLKQFSARGSYPANCKARRKRLFRLRFTWADVRNASRRQVCLWCRRPGPLRFHRNISGRRDARTTNIPQHDGEQEIRKAPSYHSARRSPRKKQIAGRVRRLSSFDGRNRISPLTLHKVI